MTRPAIAYLVNQYPKASHSFIRREILALERLGFVVHRWASRGWDADCPDPADLAEQRRTSYLLAASPLSLLAALLVTLVTRPKAFIAAVRLALQSSRGHDRPWPVHLAYLAQACIALKWAREAGVTHVHAHFGTNPAEVAMLLSALGGPPFSFTAHGPEEFDKPKSLHLQRKIQHSAFVVAISSYGRSQLYRWAALADWSKVKVVHCGLDAQFTDRVPQPVTPWARLVCVGRLCEQKGQSLLIHAMQLLLKQGVAFELVLAGDGEMRIEIEALIRACSLTERVRITGWISGEQVSHELEAARALVLPSFAEGLPVVIMEAMALGRPVISTFVAGIPELVRPGENGWLVPAGDIEALAGAMRACLQASPDQLNAMGAAGRERVLQRHCADGEAAKLAACFQQSASSADMQAVSYTLGQPG
jgi:colanic acid/amylovoran biosynthesis glycosyltransferase